jgi:hypothetical protein
MAKTRHQQEPTSNRATMLVLVAGGVLVAALVVWALTRTVEPAAESAAGPVAATAGNFDTVASTPASTTQPITATSPTASTTAAAPTPPPQPHGDRSSVKRIAAEDLRAKMNRNEVTVIDVRDAASYGASHIAGAINIPFASVESMLDLIPKDKPVVTYCT